MGSEGGVGAFQAAGGGHSLGWVFAGGVLGWHRCWPQPPLPSLAAVGQQESNNMVVPAMQLASKIPDMSVQLWSSALLRGECGSQPFPESRAAGSPGLGDRR